MNPYFTSLLLAEKFILKNTTIVGQWEKTVVKYQTEAQHWKRELYSGEIYSNEFTLKTYKTKKEKECCPNKYNEP